MTVKPAPAFATSSKMTIVALYRASPLAVIGTCLTGAAHGTIFGLGAIYAAAALAAASAKAAETPAGFIAASSFLCIGTQ